MTTDNNPIPEYLIEAFKELADNFEMHYRNDERQRIVKMFYDAIPQQKTDPQPEQIDMHGEPLAAQNSAPVKTVKKYERKLGAKHREMVGLMSRNKYIAASTLAGQLDLKLSTVRQYFKDIQRAGYTIEKKNVSVRWGRKGYNRLYRIAS